MTRREFSAKETDNPKTPNGLDAIADVVLRYRPKPKSKPARRRKRRKAKLAKAKKDD